MLQRALVVGVRQVQRWGGDTTVEQVMLDLGQNTGNMMFTQSLLEVIEGGAWGSFGLSPQELEGRDAIVLAAANWVNHFDDFGWLADRLEKTKLPVFLVGVGAQASESAEIPRVNDGTLRLLRLVQDRSATISARGIFSCEVLERYGIKRTRATGCPSLLLAGPGGPSPALLQPPKFDACCMHATRHGFAQADPFQTFLYRQAFRRGIDLVLQSEAADMHYVMNALIGEPIPWGAEKALKAAYGVEDTGEAAAFLARHGRVFTCYDDWIAYMRRRSFCFGTRIHGTIASLIAGTPATLIAHDSRTAEMADIMGVPAVRWQDVRTDQDIDTSALYSLVNMTNFLEKFRGYYNNFMDYMAENSLPVAPDYLPGGRANGPLGREHESR